MGIIISLILGIIFGYILNLSEKQKSLNSKLQQLGVVFLLFAMGASIGGNKKILSQLPELGLRALSFAILTVAGSIFVVYYISEKFVKKNNLNDIAETKGAKNPAKESV